MRLNSANTQSGNVLIYILIGIVLFAAVMFSVSKGSDNSGNIASKGNAKLQAQQILDYSKKVEMGVQKLLAKGCSESEISFENASVAGYINPNSPSSGSKRCWVFDPAGAGVAFRKPDPKALDKSQSSSSDYGQYIYTGVTNFPGVGISLACGPGDERAKELTLYAPYVSKEVCFHLAQQTSGLHNNSILKDNNITYFPGNFYFKGAFASDACGAELSDTITADLFTGKTSGCYEGDVSPASGTYHFFQVLIAR